MEVQEKMGSWSEVTSSDIIYVWKVRPEVPTLMSYISSVSACCPSFSLHNICNAMFCEIFLNIAGVIVLWRFVCCCVAAFMSLSHNVDYCHDCSRQLAFVFYASVERTAMLPAIMRTWCCSLFLQMVTAVSCWLKPSVLGSPRRFLVLHVTNTMVMVAFNSSLER